MPIVVMGVAGTGKSTVGQLIAGALSVPFTDGDDLHGARNIAKMSGGQALTDEDRRPWLRRVALELRSQGGVVACSALRRSYREAIRELVPNTVFVHLVGDPATIQTRLSARPAHFMAPGMLTSQLSILEPLEADEAGIELDIRATPEAIVRTAVDAYHARLAAR
jgi:carbohydrate kinase (thermoresistant glucokinase family)